MRPSTLPALLALLVATALACGDGARESASGLATPTPSRSPNAMLSPDQVRAVVESYVRAFNTADRALYLSLFAPNGTVEDPIGGEPIRGHEALGGFFDAATGAGNVELHVDPADVRVSGNHVAFRFTLRVKAGDTALGMQPIDTFELDADGRITAMRAYWSPTDFRPVP